MGLFMMDAKVQERILCPCVLTGSAYLVRKAQIRDLLFGQRARHVLRELVHDLRLVHRSRRLIVHCSGGIEIDAILILPTLLP